MCEGSLVPHEEPKPKTDRPTGRSRILILNSLWSFDLVSMEQRKPTKRREKEKGCACFSIEPSGKARTSKFQHDKRT
jgi:hypothetical protein